VTGFYATWVECKIDSDDESLDQIVVKLERWFNVQILFAGEHLKSHRLKGIILKNKPGEQIIQVLSE